MKRHPQISQILMTALLTAFAFTSGCTCSGDIQVEGESAISFVSPTAGELISEVDSEGNASLTVTIAAVGDVGNIVLTTVGVDNSNAVASASGGLVTFSNYTVAAGQYTLRARAESEDASSACSGKLCKEVMVTVLGNGCVVTYPTSVNTVSADLYPNADGDSGYDPVEIDFSATCVGVADDTAVTLSVNGGPASSGTASSNIASFFKIAVQEGENTAVITTGNTSYTTTFTVNTGACNVALGLNPQPEAGNQVNMAADLSGDDGLQYGFSVATNCGASSTYQLQWARVGSTDYANVSGSGAAGTLGGDGADGSYTIAGTGIILPESLSANDVNLTVKVTSGDGSQSGWAMAMPFWFDSVAPDMSALSDSNLGIDGCFSAGTNSLDITYSAEPNGKVWVRVYDRDAGDTECDPAVATSCESNATAGDACVTSAGGSYCRVETSLDAQGSGSVSVAAPAGAVAVEYVPVDAIGNEGSATLVERDVVTVDAGAGAPVAAVLQVGTQLLNEVVTADDGSKSFNALSSDDVVLNLSDRSGDTGFDVDVVVGALNVPTGSVGTVLVGGVAAGTFTIAAAGGNTYAQSSTTYSVALPNTDGVTANAISISFAAPDGSGQNGLNCLVDALSATASLLADASQPQLTGAGLLVADASCNTPVAGEDGTDGVAMVLGGTLGATTEAGTTVTVTFGTCTDTCPLGTCVDGACVASTTVTGADTSGPAFSFGTVEVPAGAAPDYNVSLSYLAADPNGNTSETVTTTIQVVPVVPDFQAGFGFQQPASNDFLSRDVDDSALDDGLQYVVTVTGTPGAIYAGGDPVGLTGSSGVTIPSEVTAGTDVWSWAVTMADGQQTLTTTATDFCNVPRSITNTVVAYTDRPDMSLALSFSDAASTFDESDTAAVTGASQMVMTVNTGAAPTAIQALGSDFTRKVRYTVYSGTKTGSTCSGLEVARNTLTPAEVGSATAGKVFEAIDLSADISSLGLVDEQGAAVNSLLGQPVCVAVTSHDTYLGTEANEQTAAVAFTQRNVAPPIVSIVGAGDTAIADAASLTIDDDLDGDLGNGFSINLAPSLAEADSATGTITLVVDAAGTGFDSTTSLALNAGSTSTVFGPVPLSAGSATLTATFTDAYGNTSEAYSISVTVPQGDGPSIEATYPVNGSSLRSDSLNRVNIGLLPGSPVTPVSCDVSIGGAVVVDDEPWSSGDTLQIDLAASDYADGALEISVTCVASSGASGTLPLSVNIDDTVPSAPILSQTVWVDGTGTSSVTIPYSSSPAYVNCSFTDTVENALGECTSSLQHAVTMRVNPNATSESLDQVGLVLTATYAGDGSTKTYTLDNLASSSVTSSDGTTFASAVVISAIAGRYDVTILNVDFGAADQEVTFSVKLVDAAGNESEADTETVTVDRTAPTFTQTLPAYEAPPANVVLRQGADVFFANGNLMDLDFVYATSGLEVGATVSLTLTHSSKTFSELRDNIDVDGTTLSGTTDFTISATTNTSAQASFARLTFSEEYSVLDGFTASITATDAAGNASAEFTYNFYPLILDPFLNATGNALGGTFASANDGNAGISGIQTDIFYGGAALGVGATITLCSTAPVSNGGGTTPCRWGFPSSAAQPGSGVDEAPGADATLIKGDSADNTLMRGFVIGTATAAGGGFTNFVLQTLPEGDQWIHAEAGETGAIVNTASDFYRFTVDSVVPVISAIDLTANDADNDLGDGTVRLSAGLNEVSGSAGNYTASVRVRVGFAGDLDGQTVTVNNGGNSATGTLSQVGDALEAVVAIGVSDGANEVTATVSDSSGNAAASSPELTFTVDTATPTSLALAAPSPSSGAVFTGADFPVVADLLNADPQDQTTIQAITTAVLNDAIVVNFSGETSVIGSKATIQLFGNDGSSNPSEIYESETVVSETATQIVFSSAAGGGPSVPLRQGLEQMEVVFTDGVGNTVTLSQELLKVDFKPAALTMALFGGGADISSSCASDATNSACLADLKDLGGGAYQNANLQCAFDTTAGNGCPASLITDFGSGACNDVGTDLQYTLSGCSNSDTILEGDSGAGSCAVAMALQSRTSGGLWANVTSGTLTATADADSSTSYLAALAGDVLHNPGIVREFRLLATDPNGNVSRSGTVFVKLNNSGTTLSGYLVTPGTGSLVDLVSDLSIPVNLVDTNSVDLEFVVTPTVGGDTPVGVEIVTNGAGASLTSDGGTITNNGDDTYTANFTDFTIPTVTNSGEAGFSLAVTILCDSGGSTVACGTTTYSDLKADTGAPSFQFNRCSLKGLSVPMDTTLNDTTCAAEVASLSAAANITQGGTASWNVDHDAGSASDGLFSFSSDTAIKLDLYGLAANVDVTLAITDESSGAALTTTNATATSSGCSAAASSCTVTFTNLTITEPADGTVVLIAASFTDPAGNAAAPKDPRTVASERIKVTIDATAPSDVTLSVCIGESTTPSGVATPSSDPSTFEEAGCSTHCSAGGSCSRTAGQAVLAFTASGDDGSTGVATSYNVKVAALEIPYDASTTYSACAELTASSVTEDSTTTNANSGLTIGAVSEAGGVSYVAVSGLLPHRSYCFAVEAVDNAGNISSISGKQAEREFFFVNGAAADDMSPANPVVTGGQAFVDYTGSNEMIDMQVLDFDGDANSDVVITRWGEALLYLSTLQGTANYPIQITTAANGGVYFAYITATGDFDNDGFDDLVFTDATAKASDGTSSGGAVYIYYGRDDSSAGSPWWNNGPPDGNHPSIQADVVLLGSGFSYTGFSLNLVNVDGVAGDELVFDTPYDSTGTCVLYGISGGDRAVFTATTLDIVGSGAGAGQITGDFIVKGYDDGSSNPFFFGSAIVGADVNGDGTNELVFSDYTYQHSAGDYPTAKGEVYVLNGATLTGTQSLTSASSLMHTIRTEIEGNIGTQIAVIDQPRAGDTADWLAVNSIGQRNVRIFKGTSNPGTGETAGLIPASYTTSEIAGISYNSLDSNDWDGSSTGNRFGFELTTVNMGLNYLVVSGGTGSAATFFYSYETSSDDMVKRALIPGNGSDGNALKIRGGTVAGSGTLLMLDKINSDVIRVK